MSQSSQLVKKLSKKLQSNGLTLSDQVKTAFEEIDRGDFVGERKGDAYKDHPLPIPENQTISAPHMYAMMMADEIADLKKGHDVLEIGTGSGYGAALLADAVSPGKVVSIERHESLHEFARLNLKQADRDFDNLDLKVGDGTDLNLGIQFDRIIVTAAGPQVPPSYKSHLKSDGKIIMPLEQDHKQWLVVVTYDEEGKEKIDWKFRVRFVPLIGEFGH